MDWDYKMAKGAQQGWQCPICGNVYAPWVYSCPCRGRMEYQTTTSTNSKAWDDMTAYMNPPEGGEE